MAVAEPVPSGTEFPRKGSGREAGSTCRVPIAGWKNLRLRCSHCAQVKTTNPQTGIVGVYSFIFYFRVVFIYVSVHKKVGKRSRDVNKLSPRFVQHLSLGKTPTLSHGSCELWVEFRALCFFRRYQSWVRWVNETSPVDIKEETEFSLALPQLVKPNKVLFTYLDTA